jgi:hypothetical protein
LGDPRPYRKRPPCHPRGDEGELPYKIKMLQTWEITPEAARFLEISNRIDPRRV